jgi:putative transposase
MADSYTKILVHCVFSTKARQPRISEPERLWTYFRGIARNCGVNVVAIGGTANHVHILVELPSSLTIAHLMRDLKANSSRYLNQRERGFAWQDGYAAISVSPSQVTR